MRKAGLLRFARNDGVDGPTETASSAKRGRRSATAREPSMRKFIRTAIDLGKNYFQVHGLESERGGSISRKMTRSKMRDFYRQTQPCRVGMEACGSAHYWARELVAMGHEVVLIPPAYIKPYVKRGQE
jgi:transposase